MRKLGKTVQYNKNTIETYCLMCACLCQSCSCSCWQDILYVSSNSSSVDSSHGQSGSTASQGHTGV